MTKPLLAILLLLPLSVSAGELDGKSLIFWANDNFYTRWNSARYSTEQDLSMQTPEIVRQINQAQKDTEALVNEATQQLNTQKEKALLALEEQVNTLSEQIKNKLLSGKLTA